MNVKEATTMNNRYVAPSTIVVDMELEEMIAMSGGSDEPATMSIDICGDDTSVDLGEDLGKNNSGDLWTMD